MQITPIIHDEVNRNNPIAVDIIITYDQKIYDKLIEKSAKEWFSEKEDFKNINGELCQFFEKVWTPGQHVSNETIDVSQSIIATLFSKFVSTKKRIGGVVFANYIYSYKYAEKNSFRHVIHSDEFKYGMQINLGKEDFKVKSLKPANHGFWRKCL